MGSIVGGVVGAIGSIVGSQKAAKLQKAGATQALTGYNYLKDNALIGDLQANARSAATGQNDAIGSIQDLLTSPDQNNPAFQNYLNSTGYQFQLGQGTGAITGSAAAKGILNSGATAKALQKYGQGLAATTFNNYLGQLSGVAGLRANQVNQGLNAAEAVGNAGTQGGATAGRLMAEAGESKGTGITNAFNTIGGLFGGGGGSNPFAFLSGGGGGAPTDIIPY